MKYKNIVIFSLEGIESNTEIHFFENGLKHYVNDKSNFHLKTFAIGKEGKHNSSKQKIKNRLFSIGPVLESYLDDSKIFFIGDGDASDDIPSMERSKDTIKNYMNEFFSNFNIVFEDNMIYEPSISFDHLLLKNKIIADSDLINNKDAHKKKSNYNFFGNLVSLFIKSDWNKIEIINLLLEIFKNTKYDKIFMEIKKSIE